MPAGLPVTHTKLLCVPKLYARRHYLPPHLLRGPSHNCFWAVMTGVGVDTMFPKQGTVFCCVRSRLTLYPVQGSFLFPTTLEEKLGVGGTVQGL